MGPGPTETLGDERPWSSLVDDFTLIATLVAGGQWVPCAPTGRTAGAFPALLWASPRAPFPLGFALCPSCNKSQP